jgi:hypothetical protein
MNAARADTAGELKIALGPSDSTAQPRIVPVPPPPRRGSVQEELRRHRRHRRRRRVYAFAALLVLAGFLVATVLVLGAVR